MIERFDNTTVRKITDRLMAIRSDGGVHTLSRVLTLVIRTTETGLEPAVHAAITASQEHPMRIIAVVEWRPEEEFFRQGSTRSIDSLGAEIRLGRDAGAGEVIILRPQGAVGADVEHLVSGLLVSDTPIVVWWFTVWPDPQDTMRNITARHIHDSGAYRGEALKHLQLLCKNFRPGDTDLSWARLTLWRAQLAAMLDNVTDYRVERITVSGTPDSPSTLLLAAWLGLELDAPVECIALPDETGVVWGIHSVTLHLDDGTAAITRSHHVFARIQQPGHPPLEVPLPRRALPDCLIEDLRILGTDDLFERVAQQGVPKLSKNAQLPAGTQQ